MKAQLRLNYLKALSTSLQRGLITKKEFKVEMKFIRKYDNKNIYKEKGNSKRISL